VKIASSLALTLTLSVMGLGCQGGGSGVPARAPSPPPADRSFERSASPRAEGVGANAPAASAPAMTAPAPPTSPTPALAPLEGPAPVEMRPPGPTALASELLALGLDGAPLPTLDKLKPAVLRGVMKLISRSLGAKCLDCHEDGDYAAPTARKKIATHMWDDFVVKLATSDGAPIFCDSCHSGRIHHIDRRDKKALAQWMDDNYVAKLARRDGKSHDCETCHVDMEMLFLRNWSR
jgi:hypothetical protein